jgi:hypothetical protein
MCIHGFPPSNGRPVARPRRLGIARGQCFAPDPIDAANPQIAELDQQKCASSFELFYVSYPQRDASAYADTSQLSYRS